MLSGACLWTDAIASVYRGGVWPARCQRGRTHRHDHLGRTSYFGYFKPPTTTPQYHPDNDPNHQLDHHCEHNPEHHPDHHSYHHPDHLLFRTVKQQKEEDGQLFLRPTVKTTG